MYDWIETKTKSREDKREFLMISTLYYQKGTIEDFTDSNIKKEVSKAGI